MNYEAMKTEKNQLKPKGGEIDKRLLLLSPDLGGMSDGKSWRFIKVLFSSFRGILLYEKDIIHKCADIVVAQCRFLEVEVALWAEYLHSA